MIISSVEPNVKTTCDTEVCCWRLTRLDVADAEGI